MGSRIAPLARPAATEIKAVGVEEILTQAAKHLSSGDVVCARDLVSKYAAPINVRSAASIALALAETYDPNVLAVWGIRDVPSPLDD